MTIIADTSVVSNLAIIGRANLLPRIYGEIVVPTTVWDELQIGAQTRLPVAAVFDDGWLRSRRVSDRSRGALDD